MKKTTLFLLAALCLTAQAFGQAARFDGVAQSTRLVNGITLTIPLPSATITVYNFGTTTKASVCPDITATSCSATVPNNPVTSDAQGNFGFWIPGGVYDYTVTPSSGTVQGPYHAVVPFGANSSGSVTYSKSFENIRFADQFVNTQAAFTDAGTTGGVMFPPGYTVGTFSNSNSRPVIDWTRWDWRGSFYAPDFNTKGDGVTDDSAALQSCFAAAAAAQGTCFIPTGTYKLGSKLLLDGSGFIVQCAGEGTTFSFDGSVVTTAMGSTGTTTRSRVRVRDCHWLSSTSGAGLALDFTNMTLSSTSNLNMFAVNQGILQNSVRSLYNQHDNLKANISGVGSFCVKFDTTANENTVNRLRCAPDANSTGVIINAQGIKCINCDVETGALIGIDVQASARSTLIEGAWLEANQTNLHIAAGSVNTKIDGEINSGTTADITDDGGTGVNICGVRKNFVSQPCSFGSGVNAPFLASTTTNSASSGAVRLAKTDVINFRNNANSGNVGISLNGSDQVVAGGAAGIVAGPFVSNNSNPASAGQVRLNVTDTLKFRNNANGADITALSIDGSDILTLPSFKAGASGATISDTRTLIQSANNCGTTTTCANTANNSYRMIVGNVALSSATPSTATITGISPAFTSTATYNCTATPEGATAAIAAGGIAISKVSGSSFTVTGPNTVTTVIDYTCVGN
jgi:hypothetical protein